MHRWIIAALAALAFAAVVAACGSSGDADETTGAASGDAPTPLKIAVFGPGPNTYVSAGIAAARKWADANGAELTVMEASFDPQKQFSQIQTAIAQRSFDGMALYPINGPSLAPLVKQADEAGIATVALNSPLSADLSSTDPKVPGLAGLVWDPKAKTGERLGEAMVEACEGIDPCQVAYIAGDAALPFEKSVVEAYEQVVEGHPNVETLPVLDGGGYARGPAVGVTQDLLQARPGVDVIAAADQSLLGAEVALRKADKSWGTGQGELRLVGIGGSTQAVQRVAAGEWTATLLSLPKNEMTEGLAILVDAIEGELPAPKGVNPVLSSEYPPIMTREAVEETDFEGQFSG